MQMDQVIDLLDMQNTDHHHVRSAHYIPKSPQTILHLEMQSPFRGFWLLQGEKIVLI